jgi:predicted nucleotidyltransferase
VEVRTATPSLLPIFRSQQQATILAALLGDPEVELSLTDLAERISAPLTSVHREVQRAEAAGLVTSRRIGNVRLVRANVESPYYASLADLLLRAFGVPAVLADELRSVEGIDAAYVYGSWAARHAGETGTRPVGDIDVLVLGSPDRTDLYSAAHRAEQRVGREVQVTVRAAGWIERGDGTFHATVTSRPMLRLDL